MSGLEFTFSEFINEIDAIKRVASAFIDESSEHVFYGLRESLENIKDGESGNRYFWGIHESNPLRTRTSRGMYRVGGGAREHIFAEITSIWEIEPLKSEGKKKPRRFRLGGLASTRIRLRRDNANRVFQQVAMWRQELGDDNSPGCHFHVQVLGQTKKRPFPKSIEIPRFPALLFTPMAALDFVLGELFQDAWKKEVSRDSADIQIWRSIQAKRLKSLFDWHARTIDGTTGSPWIAIKGSKPEGDLFLT